MATAAGGAATIDDAMTIGATTTAIGAGRHYDERRYDDRRMGRYDDDQRRDRYDDDRRRGRDDYHHRRRSRSRSRSRERAA